MPPPQVCWVEGWKYACQCGAPLSVPQVCVQAVWETVVWRPVDPEVDERLAQESCGTRQGGLEGGGEGGKVRPPCGFALLQAMEAARKVRALHALIKV